MLGFRFQAVEELDLDSAVARGGRGGEQVEDRVGEARDVLEVHGAERTAAALLGQAVQEALAEPAGPLRPQDPPRHAQLQAFLRRANTVS